MEKVGGGEGVSGWVGLKMSKKTKIQAARGTKKETKSG